MKVVHLRLSWEDRDNRLSLCLFFVTIVMFDLWRRNVKSRIQSHMNIENSPHAFPFHRSLDHPTSFSQPPCRFSKQWRDVRGKRYLQLPPESFPPFRGSKRRYEYMLQSWMCRRWNMSCKQLKRDLEERPKQGQNWTACNVMVSEHYRNTKYPPPTYQFVAVATETALARTRIGKISAGYVHDTCRYKSVSQP